MELWWWVKPLFETGLIMLLIAVLLAFMFNDAGDWLFWVCIVLLIPFAVAILAVVAWVFINMFLAIWSPYF